MFDDTETRWAGYTSSRQRQIVAAAALTLLFTAACGAGDEPISAATGDQTQEAAASGESAQACQDAVAGLPAVAAFDRVAPADVAAATRGAAGWVNGQVTDVSAGRTEPHDATYVIDGAPRSSGLQIVYADLAVEVADADTAGVASGSAAVVEIPVAYLPADLADRANEQVESLRRACTDLVLTAYVQPLDSGDDASPGQPRFGLTQLAGGMVEGVDGVRSLDPLVSGTEPLGAESSATFIEAASVG